MLMKMKSCQFFDEVITFSDNISNANTSSKIKALFNLNHGKTLKQNNKTLCLAKENGLSF